MVFSEFEPRELRDLCDDLHKHFESVSLHALPILREVQNGILAYFDLFLLVDLRPLVGKDISQQHSCDVLRVWVLCGRQEVLNFLDTCWVLQRKQFSFRPLPIWGSLNHGTAQVFKVAELLLIRLD